MPEIDPDRLLSLLRDPNVESAEIAAAAGVPREEAGRASRLLLTLARARAEEIASLPGPLAVALVRAVAAAGRLELVAALAAAAERDPSKEAKRQLHLLRLRGVAVPEPARAPPVAPAPPPAEPPLPAYATPLDDRGERAVWLPRPQPGRGVELAQAVLSDEGGLVELEIGLLGRKEWRAFVKGLLERGAGAGVAEIDRGRAHALLLAARARNDVSGRRIPDRADLWLSRLGPPPPVAPAADLGPLPAAEEAAALEASGRLHDRPPLGGWLAEEPFLREVAAELDAAEAGEEAGPPARAARLGQVIAAAVDRYLTPARRERLAGRLLDVAEHLARAGERDRALAAAAAGRAVAADLPGREIPFVRRLVEKAFPAEVAGAAPGAAVHRPPAAGAPAATPAALP